MTKKSEQELVHEAKQGRRLAFHELVRTYDRMVLDLAYDLVGNYEDARDIAQDTFMRAYQKLPLFRQSARFSTWIYRIAVNLCRDFHRKHGKRRELQDSFDEVLHNHRSISHACYEETNNRVERQDLQKHITAALGDLSMNQRTVIVLKFFHAKTTHEIAAILACNANTVRIHQHRALQKLKTRLKLFNERQ